MSLYHIYTIISAALTLILNGFFPLFKQEYSWWVIPIVFVGIILALIILQLLIFVLLILFTSVKKEPKFSSLFHFLLKDTLTLILKVVRVKVNVSGIEKIPEDTPILYVCNHQHDFDPVIMLWVFREFNLAFIGKKEIYKTMPFIAKAMHLMNGLPIDRENDREAAKTIIKAIKLIKDKGISVALFPEGYTSKTCELLPFRNGSFKIATKACCPIAVCVINNTRSIPKNLVLRKTEIEFRIIDVIYPEDYSELNTQQIGEIIHTKMSENLDEIRKN